MKVEKGHIYRGNRGEERLLMGIFTDEIGNNWVVYEITKARNFLLNGWCRTCRLESFRQWAKEKVEKEEPDGK